MNLVHRFGVLFFLFFYCLEYLLYISRVLIISAHLVMMGNQLFSIFRALNLKEKCVSFQPFRIHFMYECQPVTARFQITTFSPWSISHIFLTHVMKVMKKRGIYCLKVSLVHCIISL